MKKARIRLMEGKGKDKKARDIGKVTVLCYLVELQKDEEASWLCSSSESATAFSIWFQLKMVTKTPSELWIPKGNNREASHMSRNQWPRAVTIWKKKIQEEEDKHLLRITCNILRDLIKEIDANECGNTFHDGQYGMVLVRSSSLVVRRGRQTQGWIGRAQSKVTTAIVSATESDYIAVLHPEA
ncbi:hypothetical protein Tco_0609931 [Tanacetum coccineum]